MANNRLQAVPTSHGAPPQRETASIDSDTALAALEDADCRAILEVAADTPRTARELIDRSGVPRSTVYRKLDRLVAAGLLEERTRIRPDGAHASEYRRTAADVVISISDSGDITVDRPDEAPTPQ